MGILYLLGDTKIPINKVHPKIKKGAESCKKGATKNKIPVSSFN